MLVCDVNGQILLFYLKNAILFNAIRIEKYHSFELIVLIKL